MTMASFDFRLYKEGLERDRAPRDIMGVKGWDKFMEPPPKYFHFSQRNVIEPWKLNCHFRDPESITSLFR